MPKNHPARNSQHQHQPQRSAPVTATAASPPKRQLRDLEKMGSWSRGERLRVLWYRLRLTVAEMNYATRRMLELQAPWLSDESRR
jgi:hypothetical protein